MDVLGLIPARGGSKSIPRKNTVRLGGKPLLAYACQEALKSRRITRVLLSTNDSRIADVGKKCGVEVPFLRPARLSSDTAGMGDVIFHALQFLKTRGYKPDVVVVLQPTSPFRKAKRIDAAVSLLLKTGADTVVSVTEVPHQFLPSSVMRLKSGRLHFYERGSKPILRRQDKPKLYARNGPAVLVLRTSSFLKNKQFYAGDVRPLIMEPQESLDIDTPFDLKLARYFITSP